MLCQKMLLAVPRSLTIQASLMLCLCVAGCAINQNDAGRLPLFMESGLSKDAKPHSWNEDSKMPATANAMLGAPIAREGQFPEGILTATNSQDETSTSAQEITLDQAIAECLSVDPRLQAAAEVINQARADLMTSSLLPNPTLTADAILFGFHRFTPTAQGGPPQTDFIVGFPVDWFVFGKRAAAMASSRLGVAVSEADFADQVRQRVLKAITAYYDVLETRELLKVAKDNYVNLQTVEKMTLDRFKVGGIATIEVDRIRLAVFDAQREVRRSETALVAAKATLQALIGRRESSKGFNVEGALDVATPANPLASNDAFALAEKNRPDIISLKRQIDKADADIRVERRKAYPQITPSFGLTQQYQQQIGFPNATTYDVLVNVSLPIFDRNQGNIRKADSVLAQTRFSLEAQLNDLRSEVEQAAQDFSTAHANVVSVDAKQLKTAEGVRDRVAASYKVGGRSLLEVLDAQRAYRDTLKLYVSGQANYWRSLHRLNGAIGKQVINR
jgi:cobalt-zinc-cadmium efflux system outer membrane protein